jgi:hypothetical protein
VHFGKLEVGSSGLQGSRVELLVISTPEFAKAEKSKLTSGKASISISGFQRSKR